MRNDGDPAVSVAMAVLAPDPRHFPASVRSVLEQTLEDLELVIVEDPSDRSAAEQLGDIDDPRLRLIRNPARTSLVEQRNRAVRQGRADLVAVLDADDIAHPDWLSTQIATLQQHPEIDVVGTPLRVVDGDGAFVGYRDYPRDHDAIVAAMPRYNPVAQPGVVFRRRAFDDVGGYEARRANEDYDLWSRLARSGHRFMNQDRALVDYRVHPGGMKARKLRETIRGTLEVKRRHWSDRLGVTGRLYMLAERILLLLPPTLVLRIFAWVRYSRRRPSGAA